MPTTLPRPTLPAARRRIPPDVVSTVARVIAGGLFAVAGWTKIVDLDGTVRSVRAYRLLPEAIVPTVGTALPVLELALAALLLLGLATRLAAAVTGLLGVAFAIGIGWAWAQGLQIECGCFGNGGYTANPVPGYVRELLIDTVLVAAALWLLRRPASRFSLDGVIAVPAPGDQS